MRSRARFAWYQRLLFTLMLAALLMGCGQSGPAPQATIHSLNVVETWIQQHALPFQTVEPGGADTDLQPLKPIIGDASIVGLGEATHGAHEFFAMKSRLFEFLVTEMGFTTFAMENGWDASRQIDQYIQTGNGDIRALMQTDLYGAWQTQEVLDLIEWMRAYNANPAHTTKVHFVGIDAWNISQAAFDGVVSYIQSVDPQQTALVQTLYTGIRPNTARPVFVDYDGFSANPQATKQRYQANAQQVVTLLQNHQSAYERLSSPQAFALALQEAQVILQYTTLGVLIPPNATLFTSDAAYAKRDEFMADNVAWLHDVGGQGKMVVWAHNTHVANLKSYQSMGTFLRARYQQSYLPIGTAFYGGSFTIFSPGPMPYTAPTPGTDSYNAALNSVGIPRYILDIRQTSAGAVSAWAAGPHALLNYGVGGQDLEMDGALQRWFGVVIFIQTITPSHVLM